MYKKADSHSINPPDKIGATSLANLALDFDGVICNSVEECLRTSLISWISLSKDLAFAQAFRVLGDFDASARLRPHFYRLRPWCSTGSDFVVLQALISQTPDPERQELSGRNFAEYRDACPPDRIKAYREVFYRVRDFLCSSHVAWWMEGNNPYPWVEGNLQSLAFNSQVIILSTKKAGFISAILRTWGVEWPSGRIYEAGPGVAKVHVLQELYGVSRNYRGNWILVDDFLPHLQEAQHLPFIRGIHAQWGYTLGVQTEPTIPAISHQEFIKFIDPYLAGPDLTRRHTPPG